MNLIGTAQETFTDKINIKDWKETKRFLGFFGYVRFLSYMFLVFCLIFKWITGGTGKSHSKGLNAKHSANQDSIVPIENSTNFNSESHQKESSSFVQQEGIATYHAPQKRQKLHWGYDMPT